MGSRHYKPILVIGSIGMDQITKLNDMPQAGGTKTGEIKSSPGGKGNNQAIACARAGGDTAFIGVVGNNFNYDIIMI